MKEIALKFKGNFPKFMFVDKLISYTDIGKAVIYHSVIKQLHLKTRLRYPAPYWILDVILSSYELSLNSAVEKETEAFTFLLQTSLAKELVKLFLISDKMKKIHSDDPWQITKNFPIGIIGAGLIGTSIAHLFIEKGYKVILIDQNQEILGFGLKKIELLLIHNKQDKEKLKQVKLSTSINELKDCEIIYESINENLDDKKSLYKNLESVINSDAVLITTTSSFILNQLFSDSKLKNYFRMQFQYPSHKTSFVEITLNEKLGESLKFKAQKISKEIGKAPVITKDSMGHVSTRILISTLSEVLEMIKEGYKLNDIQHQLNVFGFQLKILDFIDAIGIDEVQMIIDSLQEKHKSRFPQNQFIQDLYKEKSYGRKTYKGFYLFFENGQKDVSLNDTFKLKLEKIKKVKSVDVLERIYYRILNESFYIFQEGLVDELDKIDYITVSLGICPPNSGGIFGIFKEFKPKEICEKMKELKKTYGERFELNNLIEERKKFDRLFSNEEFKESSNKIDPGISWNNFPKPRNYAMVWFKWALIGIFILGYLLYYIFGRKTFKIK